MAESTTSTPASGLKQESQVILCPYCGHAQKVPADQPVPDQCIECRGLFEPLSRRATQIAMGPWYIRDKAMPFRPGCSFDVLQKQIKAGKVKATTVMRGPTTKQFWSVARNVPGVAHLLGYCHGCGSKTDPSAKSCTSCNAKFKNQGQRNELGLQYRTPTEAHAAQRALEKEIAAITGETPPGNASSPTAPADPNQPKQPAIPGQGLLDEVLGGGSHLLNFNTSESDAGDSMMGARVKTMTAGPSPEGAGLGMVPPPAGVAPAQGQQPQQPPLTPQQQYQQPQQPGMQPQQQFAQPPIGGVDHQLNSLEQKNKNAGLMMWGLIGFNALLIIAVVILFVLKNEDPTPATDAPAKDASTDDGKDSSKDGNEENNKDDDKSTRNTDSRSNRNANNNNTSNTTANTQPKKLVFAAMKIDKARTPDDKPTIATATTTNPAPGTAVDFQLTNQVEALQDDAIALWNTGDLNGARAQFVRIRDEYPANTHPKNLGDLLTRLERQISLNNKLRSAEQLWADGKLKQAHAVMQDMKNSFPPKWLPSDFASYISEIEKQMKSNKIEFFGLQG